MPLWSAFFRIHQEAVAKKVESIWQVATFLTSTTLRCGVFDFLCCNYLSAMNCTQIPFAESQICCFKVISSSKKQCRLLFLNLEGTVWLTLNHVQEQCNCPPIAGTCFLEIVFAKRFIWGSIYFLWTGITTTAFESLRRNLFCGYYFFVVDEMFYSSWHEIHFLASLTYRARSNVPSSGLLELLICESDFIVQWR